jgi:putative transcriptional regulator
VAKSEAVGGAVLEALPAQAVQEKSLPAVMAKLDQASAPPVPASQGSLPSSSASLLPMPIRRYVGNGPLDGLPWRQALGADYVHLATTGPGQGRLVRAPGGKRLSHHGHAGPELVLVLGGGYRDDTGVYRRGDIAAADPALAHAPMAEPGETCVCMTLNYGLILPGFLAPLSRLFRRGA